MRQKQDTALVTGASSGLGIAIARELARRGFDLVLTARSEAPMRELQRQLVEEIGISVAVEPLDLARPGAAQELVARLDERGIEPTILINNAGVDRVLARRPEARSTVQPNFIIAHAAATVPPPALR